MNLERAIRQFRAADPQAKPALYGAIWQELQERLPDLRDLAEVGLSPKARAKLRQYADGDLLARLIEQLVEVPEEHEGDLFGGRRRRRTTYDPVDGKFNSYASDHIRRYVKSQMKPKWTPLDQAPEVTAPMDRAPSNTLPMEEIHSVFENNVMEAMNSATELDAKTKILYAIDQMPPDAVSPANFNELCRQAGLSRHRKAQIIRLTKERPNGYERKVEKLLGISQSAARKRVDRAVPHLSDPLAQVLLKARRSLKHLVEPPPAPDPFLNE